LSAGPSVPPPPSPEEAHARATRTAADRDAAHVGEGRPADGPFQFPVVGNIPQMARVGMVQFLLRCWREYGDTFRVNLAQPTIVTCHPDGIQHVLAGNTDNYFKGKAYDGVRKIIGDGVLALNGQPWRKRRTLIQPKFHRESLNNLVETMIARGAVYFDALKARSGAGEVVDFYEEMVHMTLDIVVTTLFGSDLQEAADVDHHALGAAVEAISDGANGIPMPDWLPTAKNRRFKRSLRDVNAAVAEIIKTARERSDNDIGEKEDTLLQMLLDARDADTGEGLDLQEIRNEVFTLFVAGHETTALTMTWMMVLLDGQDEVKAKLREEAERVLGGRDPTFEDLPALTYTRQVVDETLRLRCPAAMVAREARGPDNINGVKVEAGDMVMPFFWAVHRHPDFWDDPERFDPERFTADAVAARDKWAYLPFSGGSRVCIGNTFSLFESTVLLAMMSQRFDVNVVPGQDLEPKTVGTVRLADGLKVKLNWH
jgi:cytochrome P450